jgi:hypothetical protein
MGDIRTRQQALWWVAPTLRYWRECLLEGKGSLGSNLPLLQFAGNLGWYVRSAYDLTPSNKRESWLKGKSNLFRFSDGGPWSMVHGALGHPKPLILNNLEGNADAERFWRFIRSAYERFTAPEQEVASLWVEGGTLLCGWDPLPPEDGRLPSKEHPDQLPLWWFDWVEQVDAAEWTWRVEAENQHYNGVHANACWESGVENETGITKETTKADARGVERVKATGEVFTPMPLVKKMVQQIGVDGYQKGKRSLDPACGDGNFLVGLRKHLGAINGDSYAVNNQIYGAELMQDNVDRARMRLGLVQADKGWEHIRCMNGLEITDSTWND